MCLEYSLINLSPIREFYKAELNINLIDFDKIITKIDESLEYTKSLEARVGRAKFLDSKGVGVIDPGAYSTSIILKEFFKEINNEKNN